MSKAEQMGWESFGFPDPGFMPVRQPAEGLMKALAERELPFAGGWDFAAIADRDFLECLGETGKGQDWCGAFDDRLRKACVKYLNHLKADFSSPETLADVPMWTWDDLLVEAAGGNAMSVADPAKGDLSPEWNLAWLLQRRRAIDLLLYVQVPHRIEYLSGSTHNGIPTSPAEAFASASDGMSQGTGGGLPSTYVRNIYGPDHGWKEGSYCCDVVVTRRIYADAELPVGLEPGNLVLAVRVEGADGDDASFAFGGVLRIGLNVLKADGDGVFISFPDTHVANIAPTPTLDRQTIAGWRATACRAFANYETLFHFKDA